MNPFLWIWKRLLHPVACAFLDLFPDSWPPSGRQAEGRDESVAQAASPIWADASSSPSRGGKGCDPAPRQPATLTSSSLTTSMADTRPEIAAHQALGLDSSLDLPHARGVGSAPATAAAGGAGPLDVPAWEGSGAGTPQGPGGVNSEATAAAATWDRGGGGGATNKRRHNSGTSVSPSPGATSDLASQPASVSAVPFVGSSGTCLHDLPDGVLEVRTTPCERFCVSHHEESPTFADESHLARVNHGMGSSRGEQLSMSCKCTVRAQHEEPPCRLRSNV